MGYTPAKETGVNREVFSLVSRGGRMFSNRFMTYSEPLRSTHTEQHRFDLLFCLPMLQINPARKPTPGKRAAQPPTEGGLSKYVP